MDKCPYCLAETRPGDNFCLNCGNRLIPASPLPVAQPMAGGAGDATLAAPENWAASIPGPGTIPASPWSDAATILPSSADQSAVVADGSSGAQPQANQVEQPGRLILRGERGEVLQEFTLDKPEMTLGRAPASDILLAKDKLTSRRHATVHYEDGGYTLRDENSANGTFVNLQQLEPMVPYRLKDGDLIGIGEYELLYRAHPSQSGGVNIEDMPTINVPFNPSDVTMHTRDDEAATLAASDPYHTREEMLDSLKSSNAAPTAAPAAQPSIPVATSYPAPASAPAASAPTPPSSAPADMKPTVANVSSVPGSPAISEPVTFRSLTSIGQPVLPDITALVAALSSLDGQVALLQQQLNETQEAMRRHESEIAQTTSQLRTAVRRVSERMDSTIADVARTREALAWADLIQLMEDVMNNPRDIEYVGKLARKARELNKVFQIHQNVLNTMAECNSLLRSVIGEEK
jgi:pSer/pThr/pTyr-binding forkhead associated (FHA) protein